MRIRARYKVIVVAAAISLGLSGLFISEALAVRTEDVDWTNGDVTLHGTIYLPDGAGPFPAFNLLHGSGPETRRAFTAQRYARQFADHGIAMLLYDKRGAGDSTGNWLDSDYGDLASDAVQGIELLAKRNDVDAKQIGAIGASEGGWTGPLAATRSPRVRWLILISCPPMSPLEQGIYELEASMRGEGASASDIAEAVALERQRRTVQRSDQGWEELQKSLDAAKNRPWYKAAGSPGLPDKINPRYEWFRRVMDYYPLPALKGLTVPALMLYGAEDDLVDAKQSAAIMQGLKDTEHKDFTIHVYPKSGHNLTTNQISFPDDHWDRIFNWIESKR